MNNTNQPNEVRSKSDIGTEYGNTKLPNAVSPKTLPAHLGRKRFGGLMCPPMETLAALPEDITNCDQ